MKTEEIVKQDLFTDRKELERKYDAQRVERLMRLRAMYELMLSRPEIKERQVIDEMRVRYPVSGSQLYEDLAVIKQVLPRISEASRAFHRHRYNEMILEVYQKAKEKDDLKTMEKAATSYAKYNRIDTDDEPEDNYAQIALQPFTPSSDPRLIGMEPIPNLDEVQRRLRRQLGDLDPDIEDIQAEEADL